MRFIVLLFSGVETRKENIEQEKNDAESEGPVRQPGSIWVYGSKPLETDLSWRYRLVIQELCPDKSVMKECLGNTDI